MHSKAADAFIAVPGNTTFPVTSFRKRDLMQPTMQKEQNYGENPLAVRETDQYKQEYVENFVDKWDELIGWDHRAKSEGDFFIDVLRKRGAKKVLDVATGTGFHSVRLLQAGFEVVSADGSPEMLAKAFA